MFVFRVTVLLISPQNHIHDLHSFCPVALRGGEGMNDEKRNVPVPHNVVMNDRKKLSLTGIEEVIGCDEELLSVKTSMGELTVTGSRLHIGSFNRATGELSVDGTVRELIYADSAPETKGFFKRLFR